MEYQINNDVDENDSPQMIVKRSQYQKFLENNPEARLSFFDINDKNVFVILNIWNDKSVGFMIPEDDSVLQNTLEHLYFPPRYSAIYHKQNRLLEVIWTAYKLDEKQAEIKGRTFEIELAGKCHLCEFKESSAELLEVAKHAYPAEISSTGFRNMQSFSAFTKRDEEGGEQDGLDRPTSFFISNVDWDDDEVIRLVRHINFYLKFYDTHSPTVQIHPESESQDIEKNRYFEGFEFPQKITSQLLDTKLLVLFQSSFAGTSIPTNFLNLYRVIEYVSFNFLHNEARKQIKSIIGKPHALHDIERTSTDLILILREMKLEREQESIVKLLCEVVSPQRLWPELEINKDTFCKDMTFEGGITVKAIATAKTDVENFGHSGVGEFARACTKIRNALAHGRDTKSADTILPTAKNFQMLRPWVNALAIVAGEVVLHEATH